MTFLATHAISQLDPAGALPTLSQQGRASIQFLGSVQRFSSGPLRSLARRDYDADPESRQVADEADASRNAEGKPRWLAAARRIAERYPNYRMERFLQRVVAEEVYLRGVPAVEERRVEFERYLNAPLPDTPGSLELDPSLAIPDYYRGVEWHLQVGGWDGYDLYGPFFALVAGPHIFRHGGYAAVESGDDIIGHRLSFVRQLTRKTYRRIFEPGCGGVSTLACVHQVFPDAELVGCDLSPLLLRMGHATARRLGVPVAFKQRDCRDTGEPDGSCDGVVLYALLHEMPPESSIATLREAFRMLGPGGDIVISDPPPFRAVDPFQAVVLEWDTRHREEPFFTAACSANWAEVLRDIGFVDVSEYSLGERGYPWITRGRRPG
jgi:SAM-dependent methyltransferase